MCIWAYMAPSLLPGQWKTHLTISKNWIDLFFSLQLSPMTTRCEEWWKFILQVSRSCKNPPGPSKTTRNLENIKFLNSEANEQKMKRVFKLFHTIPYFSYYSKLFHVFRTYIVSDAWKIRSWKRPADRQTMWLCEVTLSTILRPKPLPPTVDNTKSWEIIRHSHVHVHN